MTTYIYALCEPGDLTKVRYVGKSNRPQQRLACHLRDARSGGVSHKADWIRKLLKNGQYPEMDILLEVPKSEWQRWERATIKFFKTAGEDLVNILEGGDGAPIKQGAEHPMWGRKHSDAAKEKISLGHLGVKRSLESRQKQSKTLQGSGNPFFGKKHTLETRKKSSSARRNQKPRNNRSGFAGVSWNTLCKKWTSSFSYLGTCHHLGRFDKLEDAVFVRALAVDKYFSKTS